MPFFGNSNFGIASISITPDIDTPAVLKAYAKDQGIFTPKLASSEQVPLKKSCMRIIKQWLFSVRREKASGEHGGFEHSGSICFG